MIDVLVPVLSRPWNVEPFVGSIIHSTIGPYRIIFICSPGDEEQIWACRKTSQDTLIVDWEPGRADYARKVNYGFRHSDSEWVFNGADDIRFSSGWDTEALKLSRRFSVIGTDDLHNPSVKRGIHSTHMLFRRSYLEEQGGTFDGTGAVFSESYDHQFIDNEAVETAKRRGEWAFAKHSVVEHLHPLWRGANWDATYEKAFRDAKEDQALFLRRLSQMDKVLRA